MKNGSNLPRRSRTQSGVREANDGQSPSSPVVSTKRKSHHKVAFSFLYIKKSKGLNLPRRRRTKSGVREANDGQSPSSPVVSTKRKSHHKVTFLHELYCFSSLICLIFNFSISDNYFIYCRGRRKNRGYQASLTSFPVICSISKQRTLVLLLNFSISLYM